MIIIYLIYNKMSSLIYVSPSTAASLFGVNERSIRRALKNKELDFVIQHARYRIEFESLVKWSDSLPNRRRKRDEEGIGRYIRFVDCS